MQNKRGQAAMEFLMTYGWAILAAVIAIGVLAYFGVFTPGKYTPSATVVNPPFYATGATISTNAVQIEIRNNGGEEVNVTGFTTTKCATTDKTGWAYANAQNISAGSTYVFKANCASANNAGAFKDDVVISYTKAGSSLALTSTGTIAGTVA